MRIRGGQDFATGLLFIVVGLAALWIGADYPWARRSARAPASCRASSPGV